jgi:hypothetical protein
MRHITLFALTFASALGCATQEDPPVDSIQVRSSLCNPPPQSTTDPPICPTGQACCDGFCIDVSDSQEHCGACGNACLRGTTCCSGVCTDLATDHDHCGSCRVACGIYEVCEAERCVCDDFPSDDCMDNLDNDGDGFTDYPADPGCEEICDPLELPVN